jgi:hypothetical protein
MIALVLGGMASPTQAGDKESTAGPDKRLQYLLGTWDVAVQYQLPDGKESGGKAACKTSWILSSRFLKQEYESNVMGQPLTVVQLLGFDRLKKKFVEFQLHLHGPGTHTLHNEGSFSDDGKVLTLLGDSIDGFTGKPVKLRAVTTVVDANHYTLEWFMTETGGKEDRKVVLKHTRRK